MFNSRTVLVVAAVLAVASIPAPAAMVSQLTGSLGTLDLVADATWNGSNWYYSYALTYSQSTSGGIIKTFQVENPSQQAYTSAGNSATFADPTYNPLAWSIDWLQGNMSPGETITFWYYSQYQPDVIPVLALAVDSGQSASGLTIGMSSVIPEPGSFAALGSMLLCAGGFWRRLRGRR